MIAMLQSNSADALTDQLSQLTGDVWQLAPELSLVVSMLLLLGYDLLFKKHKEIGLAAIAFCGLFATGVVLSVQWTQFDSSQLLMNNLLRLDQLAIFLKLLFCLGGILGLLIATRKGKGPNLFHSGESLVILYGLLLGVFLMSMAVNLLMVYLAIELVSICSYLLTALLKGKQRSEAALKYLLFGAVASAVMLYGISWLYGFTGSLDLSNPAFFVALTDIPVLPLSMALIMTLGGFLFKLGAVPFHIWSPDVYQAAPTSVVAVFSTLPKLAALVLVFRVFTLLPPVFDWQLVLGVVAIASMTFGNFSALWQKDAKRMLAYSSIAHAGFLLLGIIANSSAGQLSLLFYGAIYLVMNFGAFLLIKQVEGATGSAAFESFKGLGSRMPYLGVLFVIVMIALTGLPPTAGFTAKLYVFSAIWEGWQLHEQPIFLWLFIFGLLNTALALFYYLKIPYYLFFKTSDQPVGLNHVQTFNKVWGTIVVLPLLLLFFRSEWLMNVLNNISFVL